MWLVRGDAVAGRDYEPDALMAFWKITGEQDWTLCEDTQSGVATRHYRPFPYATEVEAGPAQFAEWYIKEMQQYKDTRHFEPPPRPAFAK